MIMTPFMRSISLFYNGLIIFLQVSQVLKSCERSIPGTGERLIDISSLHRILNAELNTLQGSAALSQRSIIQEEIKRYSSISKSVIQSLNFAHYYLQHPSVRRPLEHSPGPRYDQEERAGRLETDDRGPPLCSPTRHAATERKAAAPSRHPADSAQQGTCSFYDRVLLKFTFNFFLY